MAKAVVLLSGGLDSATTLAVADSRGYECHGLSVDYGQRHRSELAAAAKLAEALGAREHKIVEVDLASFGGSALTDETKPVPVHESRQAYPLHTCRLVIRLCSRLH